MSLPPIYLTGHNIQKYKELKELNTKRTSNPINKWANELNRHFSNDETHMANTHGKHSTSLTIREMQIKTTLRFHLIPIRMTIIKKTKCW
jgi:hypothetical protein